MRLQTWLQLGSAATVANRWLSRLREESVAGKVVVISGGTRGLGIALAREFAAGGARLALCARNAAELAAVQAEFEGRDAEVYTRKCDVAHADEVARFVEHVLQRFGRIDVVVNNAGIITVQPAETVSDEDLTAGLDVNFWGAVHLTRAAMPYLRAKRGRVVNITSIGGLVPVPHLLPYTAAKHAIVGFSEALAVEAPGGVKVTTIVPGLMRTGSFVHALVKGRRAEETWWFALSSSLPLVTISAERAARRIVLACRRGEAFVVLGLPAKALRLFHALVPSVSLAAMRAVDAYLLPRPGKADASQPPEPAGRHRIGLARSVLTTLGDQARERFRQEPPPPEEWH